MPNETPQLPPELLQAAKGLDGVVFPDKNAPETKLVKSIGELLLLAQAALRVPTDVMEFVLYHVWLNYAVHVQDPRSVKRVDFHAKEAVEHLRVYRTYKEMAGDQPSDDLRKPGA